MCTYAYVNYKMHYVCTGIRVSFKRHPRPVGVQHCCPECGLAMVHAGHDFAAPPRRDIQGWSVVAAVLAEGLRYDGFEACGCGRRPRYRPRTRAELRERQVVAQREGTRLAETLSRPDPLTATRDAPR